MKLPFPPFLSPSFFLLSFSLFLPLSVSITTMLYDRAQQTGTIAEHSRAEPQQSRAEQSSAEQSRPDQNRAKQTRAKQSRAEQTHSRMGFLALTPGAAPPPLRRAEAQRGPADNPSPKSSKNSRACARSMPPGAGGRLALPLPPPLPMTVPVPVLGLDEWRGAELGYCCCCCRSVL